MKKKELKKQIKDLRFEMQMLENEFFATKENLQVEINDLKELYKRSIMLNTVDQITENISKINQNTKFSQIKKEIENINCQIIEIKENQINHLKSYHR